MSSPLHLSVGQTPNVDARPSTPRRVFGWICSLGGLSLALLGGDEMRRVVPTLTWPSEIGRVELAQVSSDTVAALIGKWRNSPVVERRLHLRYRYRANNIDYVGTRVDVLPASRRNAPADLRRYSVGASVAVRYDPDRPTDAVLEARFPVRATVTTGVGLAILFVGWRLGRRTVSDNR